MFFTQTQLSEQFEVGSRWPLKCIGQSSIANERLTKVTERRSTMWQKSRNWKAKFGPALVLALVACSVTRGQDVRTNYMPGTDFSKYHTYAWVDEVKGVPRVGG
jgi:hypothetical protein